MSDKLIKAFGNNQTVRVIAAITTELVSKGTKIHKCFPTASAALGRMLTAGSLMGSMLKNSSDVLTLQINGGGECRGIVATAYSDAHVKGYIGNPYVDLPLNSKGKLDVGGAVGTHGNLTVIKDMGLKEPYTGSVPIYSGEIAEDIAYYFTASEQIPSAVALGVLIDKDASVKAAGGFIIQMMPGHDELAADLLTYRLQETPPITQLISKGMSIEEIVKYIFEGMDIEILDICIPEYRCNCSRERAQRVLISIGKKELSDIYEEGKDEEIKCNFCNKSYKFTHDDIGDILKRV